MLASSLSVDLLHCRLRHSGQAALKRILRKKKATGVSQGSPLAVSKSAGVIPVREKAPKVVPVQEKAPRMIPVHAKALAVHRLLQIKMVTKQDQASKNNLAGTVDGRKLTTTPRPLGCTTGEGVSYKMALMNNLGGCRASTLATCATSYCSESSFAIPSPG